MRFRFDKVDGFTRVYDGTTCLVLFGSENMILFTVGLNILWAKNVLLYMSFSHNYAKIKVSSCDSLPQKHGIMYNVLYNVIINQFLIKIEIATTIIHS